MRGVLVLDIDGTLDTADPSALRALQRFVKKETIGVYINTARPPRYCEEPDWLSLQFASQDKHHCLVHPSPPTSKVINMQAIQQETRVHPRNIVLLDDRPENIEAVQRMGFAGIQVQEKYGIQKETVQTFVSMFAPTSTPRCTANISLMALTVLCVTLLVCLPRYLPKRQSQA